MVKKAQLLAFSIILLIVGLTLIFVGSALKNVAVSPLTPTISNKWEINATFNVGDVIVLFILPGDDWVEPVGFSEWEFFYMPVNITVLTPEGDGVVYCLNFSGYFEPGYGNPTWWCHEVKVVAWQSESLGICDDLLDMHGNPRLGVVKSDGEYVVRVEEGSLEGSDPPKKLQLYKESVSFPCRWLSIPGFLCLFLGVALLIKGLLLKERRSKRGSGRFKKRKRRF